MVNDNKNGFHDFLLMEGETSITLVTRSTVYDDVNLTICHMPPGLVLTTSFRFKMLFCNDFRFFQLPHLCDFLFYTLFPPIWLRDDPSTAHYCKTLPNT